MSVHALHGDVKVEGHKGGLVGSEILRVAHTVVLLVLVAIQITDSPGHFESVYLALFKLSMFLQLVTEVNPLHISLELGQGLPVIEDLRPVLTSLLNFPLRWEIHRGHYATIHDYFVHNFSYHVLFVVFTDHRVDKLRVNTVAIVQPLHVLWLIQLLTWG